MKPKLLNALVIAFVLFQAVLPINGLAMAGTDQNDYQPGSVVTISGDNSDNAGYHGGETVHVDVSGPNAYAAACDALADGDGAWACQVTAGEAGTYAYSATGGTSGVTESGSFTVTAPPPTVEPTPQPTAEPTSEPTAEPTAQPTPTPTEVPTATPEPTATEPPAPAVPPFIQSDKADYYMGETVTLSSGSWLPGETVHVGVDDNDLQAWSLSAYMQADASGAFTYQFALPNWFVALYRVTATGAISGVATTTFTDSPRIASVSVGAQTGTLTYGTAGNATYTVTPVRGNNGTVNGTLSVISGLPSGVTASFSPSATWTSNGNTAFPSRTLTLTTSATTPAGTFTFTVKAADGSDTATNTGTLTVGQASSTTTVTCGAGPFTYNGSAFTPCSATVTGVGGLNQSLLVNYSNNTNAGTATASASFPGDANHAGSSDSDTFEITPASTTTVVTCSPDSLVYTGSALTPCTVAVTGANLSLTPDPDYSGNTNVGTATASYTYVPDANHTTSTGSDTFEITPAPTTTVVTCSPDSLIYTGSALTPCTVSVTGANLSLTPDPVYANNTNVGTATASYTYVPDGNHTGSSGSDTFEITPAPTTSVVTCSPDSLIYTGSALTPCTVSVTGANLSLTPDPDYSGNTNVGTATASYTYVPDANHTTSTGSDTFEITPAPTTTVVTCSPDSLIYTGSALTPCTVSVTGANLSLTPDPVYANNTNVGTATASYTYVPDANHTGSSGSDTFEITPAPTTTVVSCPVSEIYTGAAIEPCTVSVTGANLSLTPGPDYSDNTNVGTATASYTYAGDANHNGSSDSRNFTIDPASSTTSVTCPVSVTYTGAALTPCTVSVTGAGGLSLAPAPTYADNTDAGTASASYTYAGDANHTGSSDSENFTIDPASSTTTVTCPASVTYTGAALTPCSVTVTGTGGLSLTPTPSYLNNTNAGTASASYTYAGDANHTGSSGSDTFEITKAPTTTVVTCTVSETYTGSAIEPCSVAVTGANLSLTPDPIYTANINVGTAAASYTYVPDANHTGSSGSATFEITKADTATFVTCSPDSLVYTGSALTPCTVSVTGANLSLTPTPLYVDNINVGTATASYTYAGDDNHFGSTGSDTFAITKAASVVTVTCPVSQVYTGSAIEPCTAEATGAGMSPVDVSASLTYTDNVIVGTATADASWDGDTNHFGDTGSATFAITPAPTTTVVTCTPDSLVYTGSPLTPCTVSVTGANLSLTPDPDYSGNTNVGTATASYTYVPDANHTTSTGSDTFEITPAPTTTVVSCPVSEIYSGAVIEPCTVSVTGANLSLTPAPVYADNINVGTATASYTYVPDANHTGSSGSDTFEITPAPTTTVVTCSPDSLIYTGSALTPCTVSVTGANLSLTPDPDYSGNTNVGTATASYTYVPDANHTTSTGSDTFEITPAPTTTVVTCSPDSLIYTGSALTPCTVSVTGANLSLTPDPVYANNTNVGTATASYTYVPDGNHTGSSGSDTFEITPAPTTTVVTCTPDSLVYTGSPLTPCTVSVTGANLSLTPDPDYSGNTNVGTATASYTYVPDANHTGSSGSDTFEITPAPTTTVVSCPVSEIYTGAVIEPCTVSVTGANLSLTPAPVYADNINVGTATASYTYVPDANHTGSSGSDTFEITPAPTTTVVSCPVSEIYTGAAIEPCTVSVTGANLSLTPDPDYSGNTNVGTATASYTYVPDANHTTSTGSDTFEITPAPTTTVVSCPVSEIYTGAVIEPCTVSVTGANLSLTPAPVYADNINVGTATASYTYVPDANHTGSSGSDTFEITPAPTTTVVSCPVSEIYTGAVIEPCTVSVTGANLSLTPDPDYSGNTNVGTATASYTYVPDANHTTSTGSDTFEITPAPTTTVVSCPVSEIYTGAAIEPCTVSVTGANLSLTPDPDYSGNTNVGTATASYTYVPDANHTSSSGSDTFEITQATLTVTADPQTKVYGSANPALTFVYSGFLGTDDESDLTTEPTCSTTAGQYSDVGGYPITCSGGVDNNYTFSYVGSTLTVTKADSTTIVTGGTFTYNGLAHPATVSVTGVGGLSLSPAPVYSGACSVAPVNVSDTPCTASYTYAGDLNHFGSNGSAAININPATPTVNVTGGTFTYNGLSHPASATATGVGGVAVSGSLSFTYNGSGSAPVNVGSYAVVASFTSSNTNYTNATGSGSITINKAPLTVTADSKSIYFANPDPAFTFQYSGFVNGETASVLDTAPICGVSGAHTAVGTYSIVCSGGVDNNYSFSYINGTLTIGAWTLYGFYQPVDMNGVFNVVKNGSTVPLKFEVFAGSTELTDVSVVKSLTYGQIACVVSAPVDEIETVATGNTVLRYDGGQFIYNWKTSGTAGKCYRVAVTTQDNSLLVAYFKFK